MENPLERELAALRDEVSALKARVEAPRRSRRWLVAVVVVLCSTLASAQLVTFQADAPALASEVNGNFNQLKTWLEQKVGAVGSSSITTSSVVVGSPGSQTTLSANGAGQLTLSGGLVAASTVTLNEGVGITSSRLAAVASVPNATASNLGAGFLEGTFADPGGTIVIMASATAYCGASALGRITMNVRVDGQLQGSMRLFCNQPNIHLAFPATFLRLNRANLTPFGPSVMRTVRIEPLTCATGCAAGVVATLTDVNDYAEVTVLRLPTP